MFRRIAEPFIGVAAIIQCRKPVAFQHFEFHVIRRNPAKVADAMHFCFCRLPGRVMKPRKNSRVAEFEVNGRLTSTQCYRNSAVNVYPGVYPSAFFPIQSGRNIFNKPLCRRR